jgi:alkylresorcinol/alkylpyrone synthase
MTETTHDHTVGRLDGQRAGAPRIAGTAVALTPNRYGQDEVARVLSAVNGPEFMRFAHTSGVETRSLALPLDAYPNLTSFTDANNAYLQVAVELGEQAVRNALDAARIAPDEVDAIFMVSSTGIAVPTIDARLASRVGFRQDVKRIPLFGLGCVAGAAGMARMHDYLRGFPEHVAVLLSAELCSLTLQRDDMSIPALIGVCLFGDGAVAVVATGSHRTPSTAHAFRGPAVLATRSRLFPDTVDVMGWNVTSNGFGLVMSREVPDMADNFLRDEALGFLADHGLTLDDISTWICHPGGPKVVDAIDRALGLGPEANALSRQSMRENGNFSSASVLDVLHRTLTVRPPDGSLAVMLGMGPGFSFELLLLSW